MINRYLVLIVLFIFVGLGCARTHKTTTKETTVTYPNKGMVYQGEQKTTTTVTTTQEPSQSAEVTSETTTVTSETKTKHPGILGSTLHAVGYVISLPFIVVGGIFRMIFGG